jgi:hypothetical protein
LIRNKRGYFPCFEENLLLTPAVIHNDSIPFKIIIYKLYSFKESCVFSTCREKSVKKQVKYDNQYMLQEQCFDFITIYISCWKMFVTQMQKAIRAGDNGDFLNMGLL